MDLVALLAIVLLIAGILGTLIPLVPGGLFSLSGLYLYWWHSGFAEPGLLALGVLTVLGVLTLVAELFASSFAARAGGASWETTGVAAIVAIALMFLSGPLGLLIGLFGTVFLLEFVRNGDADQSARTAAFATAGILASTAIQVLLTTTLFVGFLVAVFIL